MRWKILAVAGMTVLMFGRDASAAQEFVRYTDTTERAFSLDVPRGWAVTGGMVRRSVMQAHAALTLRSPGGLTQMVLGNLDAYTYTLPSRLAPRENTPYAAGADRLWVLKYRTGPQFAQMYAGRFLAQQCQNVQLVSSRARAEGSRPPAQAANGLTYSASAGEAFLTCELRGHRFDAYVFAQTELTGQPGIGGLWGAEHTYMFLTPHGNGVAAGLVLARIVGSFRMDPRWMAAQLKVSADIANHAIAEASAQLDANSTSMTGTFASDTSAAARANQDEMHRLLSGFDEYQTTGGERRSVPYATATNWWSNGQGQTLGTQGPFAPGPGFGEMKRVPPGRQ
jgi:hypothetical protein